MNNFPLSDSPLPGRRLALRIVVAAFAAGALIGGLVVAAAGSLIK